MTEEAINEKNEESQEKEQLTSRKKSSKGFNLNTFLNIIILVGLILIYVLYFIQNKEKTKTTKRAIPVQSNIKAADSKIAFINTDTLRKKYIYVQEMRKRLTNQYKQLESEISSRENKLREKSKSLQNKYELNLISEAEARRINDEIQIETQNLMELNQQYSDKISDVEYQMNINFIDSVYNYLERFNSQTDYDYILGFAMGSNILYAKDTLDITEIIVEGLNSEYKEKYPEENN